MKIDEWLNFFKQHQEKKLFSLSDLVQLTGEKKSSLSVQLTRLVQANVIRRPVQFWYENPFNIPSPEEIAMVIRYPSYLSMEYALSKQGILSQVVHTLTLVTTKLPYVYKNQYVTYEYHQIDKSLFWGYKSEGIVLTAEPEKALLDLVYIRYSRNKKHSFTAIASLINDMSIESLDLDKIRSYSKKFDFSTRRVLSQLGLVLKKH